MATRDQARRGSSPGRRLGRPPTLDRDAVVAATRRVIARRGIDRTRYADVAEESGVPVTTLQHAFGSLRAMVLEAVHVVTTSEIAILRATAVDETQAPWDRLTGFVSGAILPPDDLDFDSWLVWLEFWRLAGRDEDFGVLSGRIYSQWWEYVERIIASGVASGDFCGPIVVDQREAAMAVVGVIDGLALALVLRADGPDHSRALEVALLAIAPMLGYLGPSISAT